MIFFNILFYYYFLIYFSLLDQFLQLKGEKNLSLFEGDFTLMHYFTVALIVVMMAYWAQ